MKRKRVSSGTAWKSKEDMTLVQTLTEAVATGVSLSEAFPIVAERLGGNRTPQACYARWHSVLSETYREAIQIAQRKQKENAEIVVKSILENQSTLEVVPATPPKVELLMPIASPNRMFLPNTSGEKVNNIQDVVHFLQNMNQSLDDLHKENEMLLDELEQTLKENEQLQARVAQYEQIKMKVTTKFQEINSQFESVTV